MFKAKLLTGLVLVMAVLFAQVGTAFASPAAQDTTPITGTIVEVTTETDENGVTTVLVTVQDDMGATQTVRLSVETAEAFGLVTVDPATNAVTVVAQPGQAVEIDPTTVIVDEGGEAVHPIAAILGSFFGVDPALVNEYHEDGFGFGVITQAMWISRNVNGDASVAGLILQAKESGDFSNILLTDGTVLTMPDGSVPSNWGQFKKALLDKKNNLGVIVSGHADPEGTEDPLILQDNMNGNGNGNGHGYGRDNNPGKGKGKNNRP